MRRNGLRAFGPVIGGLWLSGCALVNPHVTLRSSSGNPPTTITDGIKYADEAKAAYKQAIGQQSQLGSWLGIGLIPLGAAALGLGITSGNPAAITAVGLAGAAGYGVGTWLQSKPNQRAWLAGYNATTCAVDAILPLLYVEQNRTTIDRDIGALDGGITGLDKSLGELRTQLLAVGDKPPTDLIDLAKLGKQRLGEGEALRTAALETRGKAEKMKQEAAMGGASLKEAVDRISGQVSVQLVEASPDLQTLAGIVGGLAQSYGQFVRVPEGLGPARSGAKAQATIEDAKLREQVEALSKAIGAVESAMLVAQTAMQRVADTVNAVTSNKPVEKLRACGVTEAIVAPMTLEPAGAIELETGRVATAARTIRGGAPPYFVEPQGDSVEGFTVRKGDMNTPAFVVQITSKTPAGQYLLLVSEKTGQRLFVPVNVKGAQGSAPPGEAAGTSTSGLPKVAEELKKSHNLTVELPNPAVTVMVVGADVVEGRLVVDVTVKAKSGATTTGMVDAVKNDDVVAELLKLKVFKDNGVKKGEVAIREKKAAS